MKKLILVLSVLVSALSAQTPYDLLLKGSRRVIDPQNRYDQP